MTAQEKLRSAIDRSGSLVSAGIEPAPDYLPAGDRFAPTPDGYFEFFRAFIEATSDLVAAYKFNLAFFESQGLEGIRLLYRVRDLVPEHVVVIADAKRGDIGTTAKHYAKSLFEVFGAEAVTVNPLMGRDSAEPFLSYSDHLTYFLALTSNPGAADFILPERLYERIARSISEWCADRGNAGLVVGATKGADEVRAVRDAAPGLPFLVPGLGAQGGSASTILRAGAAATDGDLSGLGLLLHATRGLLPGELHRREDLVSSVRSKTEAFREQISDAVSGVSVASVAEGQADS